MCVCVEVMEHKYWREFKKEINQSFNQRYLSYSLASREIKIWVGEKKNMNIEKGFSNDLFVIN